MGWSSGSEIFDPVARALFDNDVDADKATNILEVLITELYNQSWDTEDESKHEFQQHPSVMEAFKRVDKRFGFDDE